MNRSWRVSLLAMAFFGALVSGAVAGAMGQYEYSFDRPGGDFHSFAAAAGQAECSTSCATNAKCRAYTFVRSTGICWMKDRVPPSVANGCCVSGVKVIGGPEYGFNRPGSDLKPGFDSNPLSCERTCSLDAACQAYTFVKSNNYGGGKCWLKGAKPKKVGDPCCISGVRLPDSIVSTHPDVLGVKPAAKRQ